MSITAISADGVSHVFPDGTDQAVIGKVMKSYAMDHQPPGTPQSRQLAGGNVPTPPQTKKPGKVMSALAGAGEGAGDFVLGAQQLAGIDRRAVSFV